MILSAGIGALLALAAIAGTPEPQGEPDASPLLTPQSSGAVTTIALGHGEFGQFTLPVSLGRAVRLGDGSASETVPFLLDTGANVSALPHQIAAQLTPAEHLAPDLTGHALTSPFPTNRFFVEGFDYGLGPRTVEAAVLPEGIDSVLGATGVLGLNALKGERVEIDFPNAQLRIGGRGEIARHLEIDPHLDLIRGFARIPGVRRPVNVLIDSGASASVINPSLARLARGRTARDSLVIYGVSGDWPDRANRRRYVRGLSLGDLCLEAFWISIADLYAFETQGWDREPAMIIGADILQHARIEIDPVTQAVSIEGAGEFSCRRRRLGRWS